MTTMTTGRIYEVFGYLLLLLILGAAALVLSTSASWAMAWVMASTGARPDHDVLVKSIGLTVFTMPVFGHAINQNKRHWRIRGLWLALASMLICHLCLFLVLFRIISHWHMLFFFAICTFEVPLIEDLTRRSVRRARRTA